MLGLTVNNNNPQFRRLRAVLDMLPAETRSQLIPILVPWTLPDNVVLKREKPNRAEEFDDEVQAYDRLGAVQGHLIPTLFGQTEYLGVRSLILSNIGGESLSEPAAWLVNGGQAVISRADFEVMLDKALVELLQHGAVHGDRNFDNFRRVIRDSGEMEIMMLDLETMDWPDTPDLAEHWRRCSLQFLLRAYDRHIAGLRYDELLPPE